MKPNQSLRLTRRQCLQFIAGGAGAVALQSLLSGCSPIAPAAQSPATTATAGKPKRGGVLRYIPPDSLSQFDPAMGQKNAEISALLCAYDTLTYHDVTTKGEPVRPQLAESWEQSPDGLSYTFKLRQGVTFQHGTPLTAKDVAYTFQRIRDPKMGSHWANNLKTLDKIETTDDYTVKFHLLSPDVTIPYLFAMPGFAIVPHDRTAEQLAKEPGGSGPFKLAQYLPGERLIFKRNENYWNKELPYLDELQFHFISEPAAQFAALTSDAADVIGQISISNVAQIEQAGGLKVVEGEQGRYHLFAMRATEKPFDDVRVRQAFKHAIDRAALQKAILLGRGAIGNDQPIGPSNTFSANVPPLPYDVAKAKQLLTEAGYPNGLEVTLSVAEIMPGIVDAATALQEMFKAAGIIVTLDKVPVPTFFGQKYKKTPFFASWWPLFSEPDYILYSAYLAGGSNETGWSDPKLTELITQGRRERDQAKRRQIYADVQKMISEQGAVIIPYFIPSLGAARANVNGFVPASPPRLPFVWLA